MGGVQSIWDGFDFTYLLGIIIGLVPALLCITLHELSHGYTAYLLGDNTAKNAGRLTLNPLKHLDLTGLLMMLVFHVGWAKPVPVNMYNFKNPKKGMAITALAGPLSNIVIASFFLLIYGAVYIPCSNSRAGYYILQLLDMTAYMSLGLAVFNLIPISPLDGSKVLFSFLSDRKYATLMRYERYGAVIMLVLMATGVLGKPLSIAIDFLFDKMLFIAQWACNAVYFLFYK